MNKELEENRNFFQNQDFRIIENEKSVESPKRRKIFMSKVSEIINENTGTAYNKRRTFFEYKVDPSEEIKEDPDEENVSGNNQSSR